MKVIKVMTDYYSYPLWGSAEDGVNIDPATLPISLDLQSRLMVWAGKYDAILNMDDPRESCFKSKNEEYDFIEGGFQLAYDLQCELGSNYIIQYSHNAYGLLQIIDKNEIIELKSMYVEKLKLKATMQNDMSKSIPKHHRSLWSSTINVAPEYHTWPLWGSEEDGFNIDPASLPVSRALRSRLMAWAEKYDAMLDRDDPLESDVKSKEEKQNFTEEGLQLACDLQDELGTDYTIQYYHINYGLLRIMTEKTTLEIRNIYGKKLKMTLRLQKDMPEITQKRHSLSWNRILKKLLRIVHLYIITILI